MAGQADRRASAGGWRGAIAVAASRVRADLAFAAVDLFLVVGAYTTALGIRMLDPLVGDPQRYWVDLMALMPLIVAVHLGANVVFGAYGHVWRYASLAEARQIVVANAVAGMLIALASALSRRTMELVVPYGVVLAGTMLSVGGMGLVRYRSRLFSFKRAPTTSRILVVGTGTPAATFAREAPALASGGEVVGFVSTDSSPVDPVRRLVGLPVLGGISELQRVLAEQRIDQVVVAGGGPDLVKKVVDLCMESEVRLRIVPDLEDVMADRSPTLDVRDISVEDLLRREPVVTDLEAIGALLRGRRVMVTGAGGSIGSEVVSQVLQFEPEVVFALDRDETLLHEGSLRWDGKHETILCDVRSRAKLVALFQTLRPQVVFHAAALKHVPVLEAQPDEAVLTNVAGTRNVIDAGSLAGMERFVLISTDKAVDPASVMGATKRLAEMLVQAGAARRDGCVYTAVRFGNVLGSRGSVVPTFVEQIKRGGPVTVTHPEMTRYFMTVAEAVQLVLHAAVLAEGSEVFVLDMGEPVKIVDLAKRLIRLAGLTPGKDIEIEYTGRRPGERLSERLSVGPLVPTPNPVIFKADLPVPAASSVAELADRLVTAAEQGDTRAVIDLLAQATGGNLGTPTPIDLREGIPTWS